MKDETIKIKGLHCKSCVDSIESKLKPIEGVDSVKVSLINDSVTVKFNPEKISIDKIKNEIECLGYNCGGKPVKKESKGFVQGLVYGIIPHTGCIAFVLASIFGATLLMKFFKPLLMNRNFFYYLILISFMFALISSVVYLRKQGLLSLAGAKKKKGYLMVMFGTTIGINLLLFLVIFPMLANVSAATGNVIPDGSIATMKIKVDIPCPGHAPLISDELKTLGSGIAAIKFDLPNIFTITYDSTKITEAQILGLDVFNTYKATKIS